MGLAVFASVLVKREVCGINCRYSKYSALDRTRGVTRTDGREYFGGLRPTAVGYPLLCALQRHPRGWTLERWKERAVTRRHIGKSPLGSPYVLRRELSLRSPAATIRRLRIGPVLPPAPLLGGCPIPGLQSPIHTDGPLGGTAAAAADGARRRAGRAASLVSVRPAAAGGGGGPGGGGFDNRGVCYRTAHSSSGGGRITCDRTSTSGGFENKGVCCRTADSDRTVEPARTYV